jgi:hypothetical protein
MRWLVGSVAVAALAGAAFGSRTLMAQDGAKQGKPAAAPAAKGQDAADKKKKMEERIATFKKLFPTAKTTLASGIEAAEKKSKGKAREASYHLTKDGKALALDIEVLVDDKFVEVSVDPMTGVAADPKAHKEGEEDDDDD